MKLKSILKNTIAMGAIVSLAVNCKPDKIEEDALLGILVSRTISSLASGNCAININVTALYFQNGIQAAVAGAADAAAGNTFLAHYNASTGKTLNNAGLQAEPYNTKFDVYFTDLGTWNDATRATHLQNVLTAAGNGTLGGAVQTQFGGLNGARGTGLIACARIPRANCSLGGATTANRANDISNSINVYNAYANNTDCRKTDTISTNMLRNLFKGDTSGNAVTIQGGAFGGFYTNPTFNADTASVGSGQVILGEKAYPKFGNLVSLGFGSLMPVRTGATAFNLTAGVSYTPGSNIAFVPVDSCEAVGLPSTGFTVTGTTPLTSTVEVAYALSTNGQAATAYNTAAGNPSAAYQATAAGEDAKICNNSFRRKSPPSASLGGGKLPDVSGGAGNGGVTALLTACTYGGNATSRGTANAVLAGASTLLTGIAACPTAAAPAAAKFGDTGLTNLSNFPND